MLQVEDHPPPPVPPTSAPKIKAVQRTPERRRVQRLELWTEEVLKKAQSPEISAVKLLLAARAEWALVLLHHGQEGIFESRAVAGGSRERWAVCTGLRLGEAAFPAVWQALKKSGYLRLNSQDHAQAALTTALGCSPAEKAWIFWVGPREKPRALLVAGSRDTEISPSTLQKVADLLR